MDMRKCARCGGEFEISPTLTTCPNCHNSSYVYLEDLLTPEPDELEVAKVERYADVQTIARINREMELTIHEPGTTTAWISSDVWIPLADNME